MKKGCNSTMKISKLSVNAIKYGVSAIEQTITIYKSKKYMQFYVSLNIYTKCKHNISVVTRRQITE